MEFRKFYKDLSNIYGNAALNARTEIFFHYCGRGRIAQAFRGVASLIRDLLYLLTLPKTCRAGGSHLAVVTLPGANGWGALEVPVKRAQEAGLHVKAVRHPRVGKSDVSLSRPTTKTIIHAVAAAVSLSSRRMPGLSHVLVASCVARHLLWKGAWSQLLNTGCYSLLLHNDFDMMSHSAVSAAKGKATTVCIQHGIPTDEFFPVTADYYVVWGHSSKSAFINSGFPENRLIEDSFGRGNYSVAECPPERICIISQSHTPVYGIDLRQRFSELVSDLEKLCTDVSVNILLHPEEVRNGNPYNLVGSSFKIQRPPHPELTQQITPVFIIGFSSTALIDAAIAGHFVVGIDWLPLSSVWAKDVVSPPTCVSNAKQLLSLYEDLCLHSSSRNLFLHKQQAWLSNIFVATNSQPFCNLLRQFDVS